MNHKKLDNEFQHKLSIEEEKKLIQEINSRIKYGKKINATQKNINILIKGLGDPDGLRRRNYAEELGNIGKAVLPELINVLLNSKNVIQRRAAAKTLKLVGDPKALPHLINALTNDEDAVVQCSAAGAIAIFGEAAVEPLILVLENPQNTQMQHGLASWCLAFIGAKATNALIKAARSENPNVKSAAISALEEQIIESQDHEALELLKDALQDSAENVQIEAIKLVGKLYKIESLITILISKLKNKNPEIRRASVFSLMQLNVVEALNPLKELIEVEQENHLKRIIKLAISKISKKNI